MNNRDNEICCVVRNCKNNAANYSKPFFSFPNDIKRAREWALLCDRKDLLETSLHKRKICAGHVETLIFRIDTKKRKSSIPSSCPTSNVDKRSKSLENDTVSSAIMKSSLCGKEIPGMPSEVPPECIEDEFGIPKNVIYLVAPNAEAFKSENDNAQEDTIVTNNTETQTYLVEEDETDIVWVNENSNNSSSVLQHQQGGSILVENNPQFLSSRESVGPSASFQIVPSSSPSSKKVILSDIQTQTSRTLMMDIPQRKTYTTKIRNLQRKIRKLEMLIKKSGEDIDLSDEEEDYEEMFDFLCEKYLTPSMAKFVKTQAKRRITNGKCKDNFPDVFLLYGD